MFVVVVVVVCYCCCCCYYYCNIVVIVVVTVVVVIVVVVVVVVVVVIIVILFVMVFLFLLLILLINIITAYKLLPTRRSFHSSLLSTSLYSSSINDIDIERNILKQKLFEKAALTNRGEIATEKDHEYLLDIITNLEAINPAFDDPDSSSSILGEWELVYTDAQLFVSSPFFLLVRELIGNDSDKIKDIFKLHRQAANTGEIGRIRQIISPSELISKVDLRVGLIPGPPFSIKGTVVSIADATIEDLFTLKLKMKETKIENSNLPFFNTFESFAKIDIATVVKTISQGEVPSIILNTYYLDENIRISRNKDDNVFVYSKII